MLRTHAGGDACVPVAFAAPHKPRTTNDEQRTTSNKQRTTNHTEQSLQESFTTSVHFMNKLSPGK
ncbi:MAG: hypothetical protein DMF63_06865 [Acidobacteria bacterium]|nr:MAG: hypothetical protein DMF63_06865 [Acidobacteriota bacterium]